MERDKFMPQGGDMHRDLEEKESSVGAFGRDRPLGGPLEEPVQVEGTMGDSRPDQIDPDGAHFVDASDDPNLHVTRRTSELEPLPQEGAEDLEPEPGVTPDGAPLTALRDQGPILHPREAPGPDETG
jgi:hypothetical protein